MLFRMTLLSLSPEFLAALHLAHHALLVFVQRQPAARVSEKAVRALREYPHLRIEIWGTRSVGFTLNLGHPLRIKIRGTQHVHLPSTFGHARFKFAQP